MHRVSHQAFAAVAALAIAISVTSLDAALAAGNPLTATDFSAQQKKGKAAPARAAPRPAARAAPVRVAPKAAPHMAPRTVTPRTAPRMVGPQGAPHVVVAPRVRVGPSLGAKIGGPIMVRGRPVALVRGPHSVYWHGRNRSLVSLAIIGGFAVGGITYAAYAYAPVEQPYCTGYTEDGCQFQWQDVPTPEGDVIPQCVAFCPVQ